MASPSTNEAAVRKAVCAIIAPISIDKIISQPLNSTVNLLKQQVAKIAASEDYKLGWPPRPSCTRLNDTVSFATGDATQTTTPSLSAKSFGSKRPPTRYRQKIAHKDVNATYIEELDNDFIGYSTQMVKSLIEHLCCRWCIVTTLEPIKPLLPSTSNGTTSHITKFARDIDKQQKLCRDIGVPAAKATKSSTMSRVCTLPTSSMTRRCRHGRSSPPKKTWDAAKNHFVMLYKSKEKFNAEHLTRTDGYASTHSILVTLFLRAPSTVLSTTGTMSPSDQHSMMEYTDHTAFLTIAQNQLLQKLERQEDKLLTQTTKFMTLLNTKTPAPNQISSTKSAVCAIIAPISIDKIIGQPLNSTVNLLKQQVAKIAAAVKTTSWGGRHGHLALVLNDDEYRLITGDATQTTTRLVAPPIVPTALANNTTITLCACITADHNLECQEFWKQEAVNALIVKKIVHKDVNATYIEELDNDFIGYSTQMVKSLIEHLCCRWCIVTTLERNQAAAAFHIQWNLMSHITKFARDIDKQQKLCRDIGVPAAKATKIQYYVKSMYTSDIFDDKEMQAWEVKPTEEKTWDAAKNHFVMLYKSKEKFNAEHLTRTDGYASTHSIFSDPFFSGVPSTVLSTTGTMSPSDQHSMMEYTDHTAFLTIAQNQLLQKLERQEDKLLTQTTKFMTLLNTKTPAPNQISSTKSGTCKYPPTTNEAAVRKAVCAIIAPISIDKIIGQPLNSTVNLLKQQVAKIAAAVKTTSWGGRHGHLALVLNDDEYRLITGDATQTTTRLVAPPIVPTALVNNTTLTLCACITADHNLECQEFWKQEAVNALIVKKIVHKDVNATYIEELDNDFIGYSTQMVKSLIEHLCCRWCIVTTLERNQAAAAFHIQWNLMSHITKFARDIDKQQKLCRDIGVPAAKATKIQYYVKSMYTSDIFDDKEMQAWEPTTNEAAVRKAVCAIIAPISIDKIIGQPLNSTVNLLKQQVAKIAAAVKTTSWGGRHGHLALVLNDDEYRLITGDATQTTTRLVAPPIVPTALANNTTITLCACITADHKLECQEFWKQEAVNALIVKKIVHKDVNATYIEELDNDFIGYSTQMVKSLIEHLCCRWCIVTTLERNQAAAAFHIQWNLMSHITKFARDIDKQQKLCRDIGVPAAKATKIQYYVKSMYTSDIFDDKEMQAWEVKPTEEKTWDAAKNHFVMIYKSKEKFNAEHLTRTDGYASTHSIFSDPFFSGVPSTVLSTTGTMSPSDQHSMMEYTDHTAFLTIAQNQLLQKLERQEDKLLTQTTKFPTTNEAAVRKAVCAIIAPISIDKIIGQPLNSTVNLLKQQVAKIAAAVKTTSWGGRHGHLALVLNDDEYRLITGDATQTTTRLVAPPIVPTALVNNTTLTLCACITADHNLECQEFWKQEAANALIVKKIVHKDVNATYIEELDNDFIGYSTQMVKSLIEHLCCRWCIVTTLERNQAAAAFHIQWNLMSHITKFARDIDKQQKLCRDIGVPAAKATKIQYYVKSMYTSDIFDDKEMQAWEVKPTEEKNLGCRQEPFRHDL
eukprot:CCRYP_021145-RA/>CCRYP_021145-RA protein AED:0.48 eAED:0.36 QI:0/0/0/0.66/1/1/6/0/1537